MKECLGDPCTAVTCEAGQFCRGGQCIDSCAQISCGLYQTCIDGTCECTVGEVDGECKPDPCTDVDCPNGQRCEDGACIEDRCAEVECQEGEYCVDGFCRYDDCASVACPQGQECIQTENGKQCVFSDRPASPVPTMPEEPEEMPEAEETDGAVFVEAVDMGTGESFEPTGTVEALPPPEPISGCQCDQAERQPFSDSLLLLGLMLLGGLQRRTRRFR